MAIDVKKLSTWIKENPSVVMSAIKEQMLTEVQNWVKANGQTITNASASTMKAYMEKSLRPLQDGVYIGKIQNDGWGNQSGDDYVNIGSYMRCDSWQTTNIGITSADADAIVIQYGGYRLGISLTEPDAMSWGSSDKAVGYQQTNDLNTFDGKARTAGVMASSTFKNDDPASYAVAYCYNYMTKRTEDSRICQIGKRQWWLPTMGDLALIHQHFETINLALQRIKDAGKQQVSLLQRAYYWSCCEASGAGAWGLNFSHGLRGNGNKVSFKGLVRPVTAF